MANVGAVKKQEDPFLMALAQGGFQVDYYQSRNLIEK